MKNNDFNGAAWIDFIKKFGAEGGSILDLGGGKPYQGHLKREDIKSGTRYYCMDYDIKNKPHIGGDIQRLPFKKESIDVILCSAVLEHIPEPHEAVNEMYRVLKCSGSLLGYVPFLYLYHGSPSDYYRFTEEGIRFLFRDYSKIKIVPWGDYIYTTFSFIVGFNLKILRRFQPFFDIIKGILYKIFTCYQKKKAESPEKFYT